MSPYLTKWKLFFIRYFVFKLKISFWYLSDIYTHVFYTYSYVYAFLAPLNYAGVTRIMTDETGSYMHALISYWYKTTAGEILWILHIITILL